MSYIGNVPTTAAFPFDQFSGTGSQVAFTLTYAPAGTTSIIVTVSGVVQNPNTYSTVGTTLTFTGAPPSGTNNVTVLYLGLPAIGVASPGNTAYRTAQDFTATASQTTFTTAGTYTVGFVDVYRNGARLGAADFTATTTTTVVLGTACNAGDLVTVVYFTLTSLVNAIPQSGGTVSGSLNVTGSVTAASVVSANATAPIQPITASVAANALTVTLNPTSLNFRNSTLTSGTVNTRTVSAAISVVVSSGSTLGTVNAVQSRLVVIALDNSGTVELAVVNISGGNQLDETNLISTTAEGGAGAADSANVIYSTTARTSVPYRVVGYIESTQATAGTWATAPSTIQGQGGQALAAMSSIGYGQVWTVVTGSRVIGTTYYNTTGKPIMVHIQAANAQTSNISLSVNGVQAMATFASVGGGQMIQGSTTIVPSGASYVASGQSSTWTELR